MLFNYPHFDIAEFTCKCGCGFGSKPEDIAEDLVHKLEILRVQMGIPLKITSAARCAKHNAEVGGRPNSTHLAGDPATCSKIWVGKSRAADISTIGWTGDQKAKAVCTTLLAGMRVGLAKTFLHFDVERQLPTYEERIWIYANT
jgi:hypothetical protein